MDNFILGILIFAMNFFNYKNFKWQSANTPINTNTFQIIIIKKEPFFTWKNSFNEEEGRNYIFLKTL